MLTHVPGVERCAPDVKVKEDRLSIHGERRREHGKAVPAITWVGLPGASAVCTLLLVGGLTMGHGLGQKALRCRMKKPSKK